MASENLWKKLQNEATCPSCLKFFKDPMILDCGHNLCFQCIGYLWREPPTSPRCPQCSASIHMKNFKANLQLAKMVEIAKELKPEIREEEWCTSHGEALKLFCKVDNTPICMVCDKAMDHRSHKVVPLDEAVQEYKTWKYLKTFKEERNTMKVNKSDMENESQDLLKQMKGMRKLTMVEFRQLHHALAEQERRLLLKMEKAEEGITVKRDQSLVMLSEELASLETFIQDLDQKNGPCNETLQNAENFLLRYQRKKMTNPVVFSPTLKWQLLDFSDINRFLEGLILHFKDQLVSGLNGKKVNVCLDALTANRCLVVSEDCKSVRMGTEPENMPDSPERFDSCGFVLGFDEFTGGRHFWDVCVGSEERWAIGVAKKSLPRKGGLTFPSDEGIWQIGKWEGEYRAYDPPLYKVLSLPETPYRIRVALNYEGRRVAFYDADRATFLYAYTDASFNGEVVQPWFYVLDNAHLVISP